jgi:quinoprotein glucose dehydrogenase
MRWAALLGFVTLACAPLALGQTWPTYGGDAGGTRFSGAAEITPANVGELRRAWVFHTGDLTRRSHEVMAHTKFEATPILVDDRLVFCSPFNEVIALDPATGRQLWRYDPQVSVERDPGNMYVCRGVTFWRDASAAADAPCRDRIFMGTVDSRLIALDAQTGALCAGFGENGQVHIDPGTELLWDGEFQISSAPVVARDVLIVGSSISDNARVAAPHGTVRAFDPRSGRPLWTWDAVPRNARDPAAASWGEGWREAGHANVWAPMSVDDARGLVFLPTTSPSPDFFGGLRPGDNHYANSVVALHAETGALAWSFQTTHHDVWDYDIPAQPTLTTLTIDGQRRDVVVQTTKQGFLFVLDRDTGQPVFRVEERPVPQSGAPGEALSPTQPFPADLPPIAPSQVSANDAWGFTPWDRGACRRIMAGARNDGIFTPPSTQGTLIYPFTGGGSNWGGVAVSPSGVVYANTSNALHLVTLVPSDQVDALRERWPDREISRQRGAPFGMMREVVLSPLGVPCNRPPWGSLYAVDLNTHRIAWRATLGTTEALAPLGITLNTGTPTLGGPLATRGGLVFVGATIDPYLRAFDARSGRGVWAGRLPAAGYATPMSYQWRGRQYIVIAAGGHGELDLPPGDAIVAFALPAQGEARRSLWDRTIDQPGGRFKAGLGALIVALIGITVWFMSWRRRRKAKASG